jgi:electron transport complex protein RnfC
MLEKIDEIILGTRLIMKITGAGKAVIAIGAGDDEAASLLAGKLDGDSSVRPVMLKNKYPQGNERLLARSIFKKESPSFITCNVSNVYAVYEAVIFKKPLIERYVTYTGDAAPGRGNYKIRIGTPISFLTGESGMPLKECRIIAGDVMTGYDVTVIDMPLTKGIAGIVVMPDKKNYSVRDLSCIRCSRCVLVCPMRLNPYELSRLCREDLVEEAAGLRLNDCIECGCCSYSCPSSIPLAAVIRHGKNLLEARVGLL